MGSEMCIRDSTKTVEANVQINFIGTPIGVKEEGGLVQTVNATITISTLPTNIPSSLDLDISELNVDKKLPIVSGQINLS